MRLLVALLIMLAVGARANWFLPDDTCKWTREDAITCIGRHVDTNHDGWVSRAELASARTRYTGSAAHWLMSGLGWLQRNLSVGIDVSAKKVFADCDYDHDGKLTPDDFRKSDKTCLPSQTALCMLKKVCDKADAHQKPGWFT
jgi:EF hand